MKIAARFALPLLALSAVSLPALAQSAATGSGMSAPAMHQNGAMNGAATSVHDPLLTQNGNVRSSKLVGSDVYNDRNQKIGSVDDLIVDKSDKVDAVILSVGGFLGMDSKLVSVPYSRLHMSNSREGQNEGKVVMNGATEDSLKAMSTYHYDNHS